MTAQLLIFDKAKELFMSRRKRRKKYKSKKQSKKQRRNSYTYNTTYSYFSVSEVMNLVKYLGFTSIEDKDVRWLYNNEKLYPTKMDKVRWMEIEEEKRVAIWEEEKGKLLPSIY